MAERPYESMPPLPGDVRRPRSRLTGRLVWGLVILGLGAAWTLDNLGLADADAIVRWWPLLLVAFGIAKITGGGARRSTFSGTLWLIAGGWLMLDALGLVRMGLGGLWPLVLILIGGRIILRSLRPRESRSDPRASTGSVDEQGRVKVDVVMATVERRIPAGEFGGGTINVSLGSVQLDLRDATLAKGRVELETNAVMAGIELIVPRGWRVVSDLSCVMGTVEDKTERMAGSEPARDTLFLRGAAIMASIEIKH